MIDININNYEAYLLDLAEGELSSADEKLLMLFLDKNPEIKAEHDHFELEQVSAENIYFENKSSLKKTGILDDVSSNNFDELCIARIEGDLKNKEITEFDKIIKTNDDKEKEYNLFKLTQLSPDKNRVFQNKKSLKRKEVKTRILSKNYTVLSIAASIIILIGLYLLIPKEKENAILVSELNKNIKVEKLPEIIKENKKVVELDSKKVSVRKIAIKDNIPKQIQEVKELENSIIEEQIKREITQIAFIDPVEIKYNFVNNEAALNIVYVSFDKAQKKDIVIEESNSFGSYLAQSFNKRILKKGNKNKVELFDIAQVSLERVNKLTGSKMSLERVYNENGVADRTKFNSRLLAFSTPIKKDKNLL
ncbi:MAG: hypothetical protein GQ564_16520 [Bacteroidales bacterium]|nr:hypothetical protein [Bacteroidales bacterium]